MESNQRFQAALALITAAVAPNAQTPSPAGTAREIAHRTMQSLIPFLPLINTLDTMDMYHKPGPDDVTSPTVRYGAPLNAKRQAIRSGFAAALTIPAEIKDGETEMKFAARMVAQFAPTYDNAYAFYEAGTGIIAAAWAPVRDSVIERPRRASFVGRTHDRFTTQFVSLAAQLMATGPAAQTSLFYKMEAALNAPTQLLMAALIALAVSARDIPRRMQDIVDAWARLVFQAHLCRRRAGPYALSQFARHMVHRADLVNSGTPPPLIIAAFHTLADQARMAAQARHMWVHAFVEPITPAMRAKIRRGGVRRDMLWGSFQAASDRLRKDPATLPKRIDYALQMIAHYLNGIDHFDALLVDDAREVARAGRYVALVWMSAKDAGKSFPEWDKPAPKFRFELDAPAR
jgi:hypothetical protein